MIRLTLLVTHPYGMVPGQRFRCEQWLGLLPEGSVRVDVRPLFTAGSYPALYEPGGTLRKARQAVAGMIRRVRDVLEPDRPDVVLVYRDAFPLGPPLFEWLLSRRYPLVLDFDDAIFLRSTSEANRLVACLETPSKTAHIASWSTITTVGNEYLAEFARRHSRRVEILPTTLDIAEYQPRPPRPAPQRFRMGWSGSATTVPHLESISGALVRALHELDADLSVLGAKRFALSNCANVEVRQWRRETERQDITNFDVGLMPLPDDEWCRGKCGFKALLYMALGVPTIASPVGVNTEIIEDGVNGLLASTEDEWVEAIRRLASDAALRERLSTEGRRTVVDRYSGQRWAPRFLEVLEEAASSP